MYFSNMFLWGNCCQHEASVFKQEPTQLILVYLVLSLFEVNVGLALCRWELSPWSCYSCRMCLDPIPGEDIDTFVCFLFLYLFPPSLYNDQDWLISITIQFRFLFTCTGMYLQNTEQMKGWKCEWFCLSEWGPSL